jgi:hypothetical protein
MRPREPAPPSSMDQMVGISNDLLPSIIPAISCPAWLFTHSPSFAYLKSGRSSLLASLTRALTACRINRPKEPRAQLSIPRSIDDTRLHRDWPVGSPSSCALHLTLRSRIMLAAPDRFDRVRDENRRRDYPNQFPASSRERQSTRTRRMVGAELVLLFL